MCREGCRFGRDSARSLRITVSVLLVPEISRLNVLSLPDTDVLYIKLFSKNFVVLNSSEAISDLLDKRSTIYSDRVRHLAESPSCSLTCVP